MDRYIRHAVYVERFKAGEAKKIAQHLNKEVFPELIDKLMAKLKAIDPSKLSKTWTTKRLKGLIAATDRIITTGMMRAEETTVNNLMDLAEWEARWNKNVIENTVPLDIDMTMPNPEVLRQSVLSSSFEGHKLKTWFKAYSKSVRVGMMGAVRKGIAGGESIPDIGRRLRKVASLKRKQAEAIARTAVSSVVNNARDAVYEQNTDLVKAVQFVATLDTRTTLTCIGLDGKVFPTGEGPRPPMHFACRSTTIPIISSWKEFGIKDPPPATRASMTGAVPAKTTYKSWLKKQNKATQIKVLGKKRAELYRSGQVTIDKFVGKDYKPLTLKQIAKREGVGVPAPRAVKTIEAIPIKGTGEPLTSVEKTLIKEYTDISGTYTEIIPRQLGKVPAYSYWTKKQALGYAGQIEDALKKLPGQKVTSYRAMDFATAKSKAKFMKELTSGEVWRSKTFLSTSTMEKKVNFFIDARTGVYGEGHNLVMVIKGRTGRDIAKWSAEKAEREILFIKGTTFKIDKIVGNKVFMTEITKQTQLKKVRPISSVTTTSKVGTSYVGTTSKEFRKLVDDTIEAYPEKVKLALNDNGISYKVGNKLTEIFPDFKGKHPRGWPSGTTWDSVNGVYIKSTKSITVAETYRPVRSKVFTDTPKSQIKGILNHETGHGFNRTLRIREKILTEYCNTGEFKTAYAKDFGAMTKDEIKRKGLQYYHQAGEAGRSETFAEVFADIMGQGAQPEGIDISEYFPNCRKYIEDLLK